MASSCPVCLEAFTSTPRALPCSHTFCERCLQRVCDMHTEHGLDRFPCPYCRGATAIPEEGATAFPVNASIGWSELDHLPVCPSHAGEKLRFVCIACRTCVCRVCKDNAHDTHKTEQVFSRANQCRRDLTLKFRPWLRRQILTTEGKLAAVDKKERSATARFNSKARIIAYTVKETEEATRVWRQEKNRKLFLSQVKASSDFRRWRIKVTKELDHLEDLLARVDHAAVGESDPCRVVDIHHEMLTSSLLIVSAHDFCPSTTRIDLPGS